MTQQEGNTGVSVGITIFTCINLHATDFLSIDLTLCRLRIIQ